MRIVTLSQLQGLRVVQSRPQKKKGAARAHTDDAQAPTHKRIGKLSQLVFSPSGKTVVGVLIRRPDVGGMLKRNDLFCTLDGIKELNNAYILVSERKEYFNQAACKRLNIDWDACIMWTGMDVRTRTGKKLGYVSDVRFDLESGRVAFLGVGESNFSSSLLGLINIPSGMLLGYDPADEGYLVVDDEVASLDHCGGVAGRAGEFTAHAKEKGAEIGSKAKEMGHKAAAKAGESYELGTHHAGELIAKVRHAYREATQDEPEYKELPAEDVHISRATNQNNAQSPIYIDAEQQDSSAAQTAQQAASAVGRQIGRTKNMFKAFKDEFNKNSQ